MNLERSLDCRRTLADKPVVKRESCPADARTLANCYAMLDPVRLALTQDRRNDAFVGKRHRHDDDVWTRIMMRAGAVGRYAAMSCLVASTSVLENATQVCVGLAKLGWTLVATVEKWRRSYYAPTKMMS